MRVSVRHADAHSRAGGPLLWFKNSLRVRQARKRPFLICADDWHEATVSDRRTFFDARWAHQKLNRFIGIDVPPRPRPELPVGAPYQSKVL